ncbi:TRAP transporter large permease subunit [Roseicyclus sp.]|uniref:TRAP transporter large permease subunit n=1 Tax=Roseicyclus sp. TaxID=1914329 RepID=UPI003F6951E6
MELYKKVRLACAEGMSKRAAAKHFNISRGTVEKMLAFSVPPGYRRDKPIRRPKLDGFTEFIDAWLEADKAVHRKQRHTAKRIWERLQAEHGFTGGYTIVKDYVRDRERRTREMFVPLTMPVIILGGIFSGIVTATEGAALAVVAALFVGGVIYRDLNMTRLHRAMLDGISQTGVVMLLVATSAALGLFLTQAQVPQQLAAAITEFTTNPWVVLALLNVLLLVLGMFLHGAAAIILVVPIVMPLVSAVGIDPVHFGIIVTLNLAIGQQTPPVASVLITACSIAKAGIWETTRTNLPFIGVLAFILLLVTYVPQVSLGLVGLLD